MICAIRSRRLAHVDSTGAIITLKRKNCCSNQHTEKVSECRASECYTVEADRKIFTDLDLLLEEVDLVLLLQKLLLLSCNLVEMNKTKMIQ